MDSLVNYGSEDEYENENSKSNSELTYQNSPGRKVLYSSNQQHSSEQLTKYDDGTNYDDVTMDMSEDSSASISDDEDMQNNGASQNHGNKAVPSGRSNSPSGDTSHFTNTRCNDDNGLNRYTPPPTAPMKRGLLGDRPGDPNTNLPKWNRHSSISSSGSCSSSNNTEINGPDEEKTYSDHIVPLMNVKPFGDSAHSLPSSRDNRQDKQENKKEKDYERDRDGERDKKYNRDGDKDRDRDRHISDRDRHPSDRDRHPSDRDRYTSDRDRRHRKRSRSRDRDRGSKRRSYSRERDRDRDRRGSKRSPCSPDRRPRRSPSGSPAPGDYRPSYKISKKLHAMEKMGMQIKTPDGSMTTPQMLMQKSLDDQVEKVKNATGIELPKYYNPAIMNPLKYAEQVQKKKLLWGNKSKESADKSSTASTDKSNVATKWQGAKFAQDNDGKVASKFLRLMGVKDPNIVTAAPQQGPGEIVKKQEEMFEAMQAQYDVARATTHTMRGVGLGFGSTHRHF